MQSLIKDLKFAWNYFVRRGLGHRSPVIARPGFSYRGPDPTLESPSAELDDRTKNIISSSFEFIDALPWAEVSHAYGIASDSPESLRRLFSHNAHERMFAVHGFLFSSAFHQYTLYPATPFVVQCVIKLLGLKEMQTWPGGPEGSPMASELLAFLRICFKCGQGSLWGTPHPTAPTIEEAVRSGREVYSQYVNHPDSKVREEVFALLQFLETS